MKTWTLVPVLAAAALVASSASAQSVFELQVERVRTIRNERGRLRVDASGISFQSEDGKTSLEIPFGDLRQADVADPRGLRFETYDTPKWKPLERREYVFRASGDAPVEGLAEFLAAHIARPVIGHYPGPGTHFSIPAYHRRLLGGAPGTLELGSNSIRFVSSREADSRTWLYSDIETIGMPSPFRFRITTTNETFLVELKEKLPRDAYEFAWSKVYADAGH